MACASAGSRYGRDGGCGPRSRYRRRSEESSLRQTLRTGRTSSFVVFSKVSLGLCGAGVRAVTRLVLVDRQNRIRGDTAALISNSFAWAYASTCAHDDVANLATTAARILDANLGQIGRDYRFSTFATKGNLDGYFVFECDRAADRVPPTLADAGPEAITAVMTSCFYVGYVDRDR
jgi:hypothetical protein